MTTKAQYTEQGRLNCKSKIKEGGLTPGSWQHTAYMAGVAIGNAQDADPAYKEPPIKLSGKMVSPRGWDKIEGEVPRVVCEHINFLHRARATCNNPEKRDRLLSKVDKLVAKWQKRAGVSA